MTRARRLGRLRALAAAAGVVFVGFGAAKFVNHGAELASFRTYGLPAPELLVYAVGVLELAGGLALIAGRGLRIAALFLAGDMVAAIAVSGIGEGEPISLTLAPALLVVTAAVAAQTPSSIGSCRAQR